MIFRTSSFFNKFLESKENIVVPLETQVIIKLISQNYAMGALTLRNIAILLIYALQRL